MVGPANSLEETGNLHRPANSHEETGFLMLALRRPANSHEETGLLIICKPGSSETQPGARHRRRRSLERVICRPGGQRDAAWSASSAGLMPTKDPWTQANGFAVEIGCVPTWPWLAQGTQRMLCGKQMLT